MRQLRRAQPGAGGKLAQGLRPVCGRANSRSLLTSGRVMACAIIALPKEDRLAAPLTIIPPQKRIDPELIVDSLTTARLRY